MGNSHRKVGGGHGTNHAVAESLAPNNAVGAAIVRVVVGNELTIAVALAGRSGCHTDTEGDGLLKENHQHAGQHARTIAARGIEHGHTVDGQRLCGDGILTLGVVACLLDVQPCAETASLDHGSLIHILVGEHERHVAIDADGGLFAAVDALGKVRRYEVDATDELPADERTRFVEVLCIVFYLHIGRSVAVFDELPRKGRV